MLIDSLSPSEVGPAVEARGILAGKGTKARVVSSGLAIGIDHFGHSAPGELLADKLGFTGERIAATIAAWRRS